MSTFSFPSDPILCRAWLKAIPRENWIPGSTAVICERHFHPSEILRPETVNVGSNVVKGNVKLKDVAIPHISDGCPSYISSKICLERKNPEFRHQVAHVIQQKLEKERARENVIL